MKTRTYTFRETGTRLCKIGYSSNYEHRLNDLQSGNPRVLRVVNTFPGNMERQLHAYFREHHVQGEWFELPEEDIEELELLQGGLPKRYSSRGEYCARASNPPAAQRVSAAANWRDARVAEIERLRGVINTLRDRLWDKDCEVSRLLSINKGWASRLRVSFAQSAQVRPIRVRSLFSGFAIVAGPTGDWEVSIEEIANGLGAQDIADLLGIEYKDVLGMTGTTSLPPHWKYGRRWSFPERLAEGWQPPGFAFADAAPVAT